MGLLTTRDPAPAAEPRDGGLLYGLLATVWLATLPLGSKRTVAVAAMVFTVFGLSAWAGWLWRHHGAEALARLKPVRWPLGLLLVLSAWMALQASPLPGPLVQWLSPEAWAVQAGVTPRFTLSLDPQHTRIQAALGLALALAFALVVLVMRNRQRIDTGVMGLVLIGLFQALLGLLLWSAQARYPFLYFDVSHAEVKGSFGNRNHMAGFLVLVLSMGIGLMVARLGSARSQQGRHWRGRVSGALAFVLSAKMRLRLVLVVLVIALVLTRSRMGNTAFFAAMLVTGLLTLLLSRRAAPSMVVLVASLVVIDVLVVGTWVGLEKVLERIQGTDLLMEQDAVPEARPANPLPPPGPAGQNAAPSTGAVAPPAPGAAAQKAPEVRPVGKQESVEERQLAARFALDLIDDFPVAGTGAGSFYGSFIRYRSPGDAFFDHAHNDYAETAANLGLVGLGLKGLLVLLSLAKNLQTLARRRSSMARGMAFGALMATLAMAIHATVDFNLQIPVNALLMVIVLAIGWAAAELPSGARRELGAPVGG
ncbi:MAG: O-antigen ligase family protein [Hydrogenophaga sp.]|uniref:O-antigen ligase family protein n=1 Tax=Hydrogenophaga sp. TaxID=1904254 RepID=UPI0025BF6F37|nr:O-antigen ligase family protein [Hydrogenophaga sp.]MBT9550639.1 O-antigen ligase family protein [Hydrogenophaga sp.]